MIVFCFFSHFQRFAYDIKFFHACRMGICACMGRRFLPNISFMNLNHRQWSFQSRSDYLHHNCSAFPPSMIFAWNLGFVLRLRFYCVNCVLLEIDGLKLICLLVLKWSCLVHEFWLLVQVYLSDWLSLPIVYFNYYQTFIEVTHVFGHR